MTQRGKAPQLNQTEENLTAEQQQFKALLDKHYQDFNKGDVIEGQVVRYDSNGAWVDIHAKSLAFIPIKEVSSSYPINLQESLPLNETFDFYILREDNEEEYFFVSRKRVHQAQSWAKLKELMDADEVVECAVSSVVKGGILVDIQNLRGFVPASHLRVRESYESLVGQTIPLKILSLDQQANNIILSHKKVMSEQLTEQRQSVLGNLKEGAVMEGDVVRLTEFGAFVDLGGVDGLLPLSQMSWRWVEHPSDVLKVGDHVKVEVIGVDAERQRVSLSIKSLTEDPWKKISTELANGDQVDGTITRLKHFGAFVEIYPGVEALLPYRDLMEQEKREGRKMEVGQSITVFINKFNPEERRISLGFQPFGTGMGEALEEVSP